MTIQQLKDAVTALGQSATDANTFSLPQGIILVMLRVLSSLTQIVPGQANLPTTISTNVLSFTKLLRLLSNPTNGHKLFLPPTAASFLTSLVYRTARGRGGRVLFGTTGLSQLQLDQLSGGDGGGTSDNSTTTNSASGKSTSSTAAKTAS